MPFCNFPQAEIAVRVMFVNQIISLLMINKLQV